MKGLRVMGNRGVVSQDGPRPVAAASPLSARGFLFGIRHFPDYISAPTRIWQCRSDKLFRHMKRSHRMLLAALAATLAPLHAGTTVFQSFEGDGFDDWVAEGPAFGIAPVAGSTPGLTGSFRNYSGEYLVSSSHGGDAATGTLTSPEFTLKEPHIVFLIAGGRHPGKVGVELLVGGEVVLEATGNNDLDLRPVVWNVEKYKDQRAQIRLFDREPGGWGVIGVDHIVFTDFANYKFPATTRGGKPLHDGLVPTDVIGGAMIPEGVEMKLTANFKEQGVKSPTALAFDSQNRVLVSETHRFRHGVEDNRNHLYWFLDDLAAQTTADRLAMHEKWKDKLSLEWLTEKSEYIRLLEDTTGDGAHDSAQIYAGEFNDVLDGTGAGVFEFEGTVYFANIPKLWMLRDTNGDGKADERKVIEDGFGVRVSYSGHDMNGFALGPDGRIYGTIGDRGYSLTTKEGRKYHAPGSGAIFRFEPDGTQFEIVHSGLRNPKEIAFDAWGHGITVDNNSDQGDQARVVYMVEGADSGWEMEHQAINNFHRQIGMEDRPANRWMADKMWELENDVQPAFVLPPIAYLSSGPSGLTVHPGAGFLESEAGRFLICDYRGGATNSGIWSFEMKPKGAGMEMSDSRKFNWGTGATDVEYSWDGRVVVTDFVNGWQSHDDGRVYSLDAGENAWRAEEAAQAAQLIREGFGHRDSSELAGLLKHADARIRLRAQIELTRKPDGLEKFAAASASADEFERLHGIWGLGILSRRGPVPSPASDEFAAPAGEDARRAAGEKLASLLGHEDAEIRAQVLRSIVDAPLDPASLPLVSLLKDSSPRVRFFAALAIGKMKSAGAFDEVVALLEENNNADRHLRHAGIYALEHMGAGAEKVAGLRSHPSAAVRLAAVVTLRRINHPALAEFIKDDDLKVANEAIMAITDTVDETPRAAVSALLDDLDRREWTPFMLRRLLHNAFRTGTTADLERLIQVATRTSLPEEARREALRLVSLFAEPPPVDQFNGYWNPLPPRDPAPIRAALNAALPGLLAQDGFVLTAALGLMDQYDLDPSALDDATLRGLAANGDFPPDARAKALEIYVERAPADLAELLSSAANDPADAVALAALAGVAKLDPQAAVAPLEKAIGSGKIRRGQSAWGILGGVQGDAAAALIVSHVEKLKAANGISPQALELIDAASQREEPAVKEALASFQQSLAAHSDPLAKWNPALEGGDATAGEALFASHPTGQCLRCHKAEGGHSAGGEAGPNLAGIANSRDRRYFLESMVAPSAEISPGYGTTVVSFKNGATLAGNLLAEADEHLDLDNAGTPVRVKRSDVESFTPPVSAMPAMEHLLSTREMRDLVAWMATLKKEGDPVKRPEPQPFDPASLPTTKSAEEARESAAMTAATAAVSVTTEPIAVEAPAEPVPAEDPAPGVEAAPVPEAAPAPAAAGELEPAVMKLGQQQFIVCGACHGQSGEGTAAGPPLAGAEWVNGPAENLIRIQLRGLTGPVTVKGVEYNMPGGMQPMAYQTDEQIAAVLTYVRNSFGNSASAVTPEEVAAHRGEVGQPQLTVADLIPVTAPAAAAATGAGGGATAATPAGSGKYDKMSSGLGMPTGVLLLILGFVILCGLAAVVKP
jgi:quinoprotein glucose dehydrogenase